MSRFKTEEEKKAWGEKMKQLRDAKKTEQTPNILDVTRDNLISEADLIERVRRMFDDGRMPTLLKVNSKQLLEILDTSTRWDDQGYASPFGYINVQCVPAKELL